MSELDPELKHLTGGVGGMVRDPSRIFTMPPISSKLQSLIHNGRLGLYGCDIGGSQHAVVFVCYGWTGGHQDDWAANRTDGLMEVILDEVQLRSQSQPILLVGDFNCTPDRLPHLQALINDFSFVDFGAKASFWGGQDNQDTCFSHNTTAGSRSDFVLCNAAMVPFVHRFEVQKDEAFPVHHVLRLSLHALGPSRWNNVNKLPPSMEALISQIFEDSIMDEDLSNKDRTAKWNLFLESFQNCVSKHLDQSWGSFSGFCSCGDTNSAFLCWSRSVETAFVEFCRFPSTSKSMHLGRGQPHFKAVDQTRPPPVKKTTQSAIFGVVQIEQGRLSKQYRRLRDWNARMHKWLGRDLSPSQLSVQAKLNHSCMRAVCAAVHVDHSCEAEWLETLCQEGISDVRFKIVLLKGIQLYKGLLLKHGVVIRDERYKKSLKDLAADKSGKATFKRIRGPASPPLLFVSRTAIGPQGQAVGSIATNPEEVDQIVQSIWSKVYDGNIVNTFEHV